mgnify:CR=1 FL=1
MGAAFAYGRKKNKTANTIDLLLNNFRDEIFRF